MNSDSRHWRIEQFLDESDPFGNPVWYVMEGNLVITETEIRTVAEKILQVHAERYRFELALREIVNIARQTDHEEIHSIAFEALEPHGQD